jgi:cell pole-organizing protein PopZ
MADRLTNVEIEDILSSIRRLVSEEARPPLVRQPPRLVLTEANRVDLPPPAAPAEDLLEARISELEALLGVPSAFEPDEGDPFPADPPATVVPGNPAAQGPRVGAPPAEGAAPAPAPGAEPRAGAMHDARSPAAEPVAEPGIRRPATAEDDSGAADDDWIDAAPREADDIDDGTDVIDEHVLREMVRDILREELQGTLGERITRNVRKLVRAEIARALASRDL